MTEDENWKIPTFKEYQEMLAAKAPAVIWYETTDEQARANAESTIEEGKTYQIDNRYSARYDVAHQPNQKNHTHVYLKGKEVCVVNHDGTPSHGSRPLDVLPTKIQSKIRDLKLVESAGLLMETASGQPQVLLPRALTVLFWLRLLKESKQTDNS